MDAPSVHGDEQQSAATRCVAATPSTYSPAEGAPDLALSGRTALQPGSCDLFCQGGKDSSSRVVG
ncbi:hypothetical protein DAI22_05g057850 [Oryza sativa Japonica Group]|jgi:hypothetical protein|nr:hypothetical protein DAI22_05g057850 [Oryza sativa Japonica Group]